MDQTIDGPDAKRAWRKPGIYAICNAASGRVYVGSAVDIASRISFHRRALINKRHANRVLQRSFDKHGEARFRFVVLEFVPERSALLIREQHWINALRACDPATGFNIRPHAQSNLGMTTKPETRAKQSAALKGRKLSAEHREKMRRANLGQKRARSAVEKQRAALTGYKQRPEVGRKISAANTGRIFSAKHRENLRLAGTGKPRPETAKAKQRAAMTGRKQPPEHTAKIKATKERNRLAATAPSVQLALDL